MMTQLIYDGTLGGLLTVIFEAYERRLEQVRILKTGTAHPDIFGTSLLIISDPVKAARVWKGLKEKLSASALHQFYSCYLSELPQIEDTLLAFTRHVFASKQNSEKDFGHEATLTLSKVGRMVHREKHRMEAFVRFQRWADDVYFAIVAPDYNVLPLIVPHFKNRYGDQRWIIYDQRRKYGIHYDPETGKVSEIELELTENPLTPSAEVLHAEEKNYQMLWQDYFSHVNIAARKNKKLHLRHVPMRYWKHLTEKQPG